MSKHDKKIKIQGVPPAWDDQEYLRRLDMELHAYHHTAASLEMIHAPLEHNFLNLVIEKAQQGYSVSTRYPVEHGQLSHTVMMIKPLEMQEADIEHLKQKTKADYVEHLKSEHKRYQDLLREQLVQADEERQRLQREKEEAKKQDVINKQVEQCYSPLVIPDDIPEQKAVEFSTDMQG
ncbi:hypothetical protein [Pseudomonas sp. NPDC087817]|uniref:hypothetical protein n=1 Tax=Pseudomonas sp. NPDC087817 TaxID=3364451 RepID=UPI0037FCBC75